jgi:hypothetical protein
MFTQISYNALFLILSALPILSQSSADTSVIRVAPFKTPKLFGGTPPKFMTWTQEKGFCYADELNISIQPENGLFSDEVCGKLTGASFGISGGKDKTINVR